MTLRKYWEIRGYWKLLAYFERLERYPQPFRRIDQNGPVGV